MFVISVVYMLIMNVFYDGDDVCLSSCFDWLMNEKCIYAQLDGNAVNVMRQQCFLAILR